MSHWRDRVSPHPELLAGRMAQADFAADLSAVWRGRAPEEYQRGDAFFARTYLTSGVRRLLLQVTQRLVGGAGAPTIALRTGFGGGKTHALLATLHWLRGAAPSSVAAELNLEPNRVFAPAEEGQTESATWPQLGRVAILDGTALSPGTGRRVGRGVIRTLWGELASQLAGTRHRATLRAADAAGTAPSKETLVDLLEHAAPCVLLIDEVVAYLRQFPAGESLVGGTLESNLSFLQSLADAVKQVPRAVVVLTLPRTDDEAGGERGVAALRALEAIVGRTQVEWRPVDDDELPLVVRRRLFAAPTDEPACRAECERLWQRYVANAKQFPVQTQQPEYLERLVKSYPLHPELFERLASGWLAGGAAGRARGLLRLTAPLVMASLRAGRPYESFLLPASVCLADAELRGELLQGVDDRWRRIIDEELDGERSTAARLDHQEPRLGAVELTRRLARCLFLNGVAPRSAESASDLVEGLGRGVDRRHVALGATQPDDSLPMMGDALDLLAENCGAVQVEFDESSRADCYRLNCSTNLVRDAERRRQEFLTNEELLEHRLRRLLAEPLVERAELFERVELWPEGNEMADDDRLRLVVLAPARFVPDAEAAESERACRERVAWEAVRATLESPRGYANRVLVLAPSVEMLASLRDAVASLQAWEAIEAEVVANRVARGSNLAKLARTACERAAAVARRVTRDAYVWLMAPTLGTIGRTEPTWVALRVAGTWERWNSELAREAVARELVLVEWGPALAAAFLEDWYWRRGRSDVRSDQVWQDSSRYLGMPRLRDATVWRRAIEKAVAAGVVAVTPIEDAWLLRPPNASEAMVADHRRELGAGDSYALRAVPTAPALVELRVTWPGELAGDAWPELVTELLEPLATDSGLSVEVEVRVRVAATGPLSETTWRMLRENIAALGGQVESSRPATRGS